MEQRTHDQVSIDAALRELIAIPEVWIVRPLIHNVLNRTGVNSASLNAKLAIASYKYLVRTQSVYALHDDDILVCWRTENHRRSLGMFADQAHIRPVTGFDRLLPLASTLKRQTREAIDALAGALPTLGTPLRTRVANAVRRAAFEWSFLHRLLEKNEITRILVATQHSVQARAAAVVGRETGTPTVYVPHAPVADNRFYADIPFDYAALRGQREVDYYVELGADRRRLVAIGNMTLDSRACDLVQRSGPIVVAPSPWPRPLIERFFQIVNQGVPDEYLVCPHPRLDLDAIKPLLPGRAQLETGRSTFEQLIRGTRLVIQSSSGVAAEALLLGLPVVEVCLRGPKPNYPIIREPYVSFAYDAEELSSVMHRFRTEDSELQAKARRAWAREWCVDVGDQATQNLVRLLDQDLQSDSWLLDGWREVAQ